jgi:hypothetical protein
MSTKIICGFLFGLIILSCQSKKQSSIGEKIDNKNELKNEFKRVVLYKNVIDTISDWNLDVAVLDQISNRVNWKDTTKSEFQSVSHLDSISRGIYATWILDGQVKNGGFNQFFYNYNGDFLDDAICGFKFLKATRHYEIAAKAKERLKTEIKKIDKIRAKEDLKAFMESYKDINFSDLDGIYFKLDDIQKYRLSYIRKNIAKYIEK